MSSCVLACGGLVASAPHDETTRNISEVESHRVRLIVSVERAAKIGESLQLTVKVRNDGDVTVFTRIGKVNVIDKNTGASCKKTQLGKSFFGETFLASRFCRGQIEATHEETWQEDMVKCVELTEGDFDVTLRIRVRDAASGEKFEIESEPLTFSLVPDKSSP